jgi:hypothetical protein
MFCFADTNISISPVHQAVYSFCSGYESDSKADFAVATTMPDIEFERTRSEQQEGSDAYLETLAVYRKIAEKMPEYGTILFHGSCVAVDGDAYLFTAKSGTGKSTHTRLWRKLLGERAVMVNDDKPLLHVNEDGTVTVYGTPWNGKHRLSNNIAVPLKAVCILERAEENHIREITKQEALPMLYQQVYRPMDTEAMQRTIELIERLNVRFYRLGCNMDISAAELSYNTMKG